VRWWRDPEWAVLQQILVRSRPEGPVVEMFRSWSKSERSGDVGFSVVDSASGDWPPGSSSGPSGTQAARPTSDVR